MNYRRKAMGGLIFGICAAVPMLAAQVDMPNTFSAGEPARASQVNANFTALTSAVEQLQNTVSELQSKLEDKEDRITALEDSALFEREDFVVNLDHYLDIHESSPADTAVQGPIIRMTGVNLQLLNETEAARVADGTGNLIMGPAEARGSGSSADPVCSRGVHDNQSDCESAGFVWQAAHNSGSHNLVIGRQPAYAATQGIVGGDRNAGVGDLAVALGGVNSVAAGAQSATIGGGTNYAGGFQSVIIGGGGNNTTSGSRSVITGGGDNIVENSFSTVSGGFGCVLDESIDPYAWGALDTGGSAPFGDC